jgi:hypothetical protein
MVATGSRKAMRRLSRARAARRAVRADINALRSASRGREGFERGQRLGVIDVCVVAFQRALISIPSVPSNPSSASDVLSALPRSTKGAGRR